MRNKKTYSEKYKSGSVIQGKKSVMDNIKRSKYVEVVEFAKFSNGDEVITYKVIL